MPFVPGDVETERAKLQKLQRELEEMKAAYERGKTGAPTPEVASAPAPTPAPAPAPAIKPTVAAAPEPQKPVLPSYAQAKRVGPSPGEVTPDYGTVQGIRGAPGLTDADKRYLTALGVAETAAARRKGLEEISRKATTLDVGLDPAKLTEEFNSREAAFKDAQKKFYEIEKKYEPALRAAARRGQELSFPELTKAGAELERRRAELGTTRFLQEGLKARAEFQAPSPMASEKAKELLSKTQDPRIAIVADAQEAARADVLSLAQMQADELAKALQVPQEQLTFALGFDPTGRPTLDVAKIETPLYFRYREEEAKKLGFKNWASIPEEMLQRGGVIAMGGATGKEPELKTAIQIQGEAARVASQRAKEAILNAYQGKRNLVLYDSDPDSTNARLASMPPVVRDLFAVLTPKAARTSTPRSTEIMPERSGEHFWRVLDGVTAPITARFQTYADSDLPDRLTTSALEGDLAGNVLASADALNLLVLGNAQTDEEQVKYIQRLREDPIMAQYLAEQAGKAFDVATDGKGDPDTKAFLQFIAGATGFVGLDMTAPDPASIAIFGLGDAFRAYNSVERKLGKVGEIAREAAKLDDYGEAIAQLDARFPAAAALLEQKVAVESMFNADVRGAVSKAEADAETAKQSLENILTKARDKGMLLGDGTIKDVGLAREAEVAKQQVRQATLEAAVTKRIAIEDALTDFEANKKPLLGLLERMVRQHKQALADLAKYDTELQTFEKTNQATITRFDQLRQAEVDAGAATDVARAELERTKTARAQFGQSILDMKRSARERMKAATTPAEKAAAKADMELAKQASDAFAQPTHPVNAAFTKAQTDLVAAKQAEASAATARTTFQNANTDLMKRHRQILKSKEGATARVGYAESALRANGLDPANPVVSERVLLDKLNGDLRIVKGAEKTIKKGMKEGAATVARIEGILGKALAAEDKAARASRWKQTFAKFADEVTEGGKQYTKLQPRYAEPGAKFIDYLATSGASKTAREATAAERASGIERVLQAPGQSLLERMVAPLSDMPKEVVAALASRKDSIGQLVAKIAKGEGEVALTLEEVTRFQQELPDAIRATALQVEDDPFQVAKAIRLAEMYDPALRYPIKGVPLGEGLKNLLPNISGRVRLIAQGMDPVIAATGVRVSGTLENIIKASRNFSAQIDDELMTLIRTSDFSNIDPDILRTVADRLEFSLVGRKLADEVGPQFWQDVITKMRNKVLLSREERRVVQIAALCQYLDSTQGLTYVGGKTFGNTISQDTIWQLGRKQMLQDPRVRRMLGMEPPEPPTLVGGPTLPPVFAGFGPVVIKRGPGGPYTVKVDPNSPRARAPSLNPPPDPGDIPPPPPGLAGETVQGATRVGPTLLEQQRQGPRSLIGTFGPSEYGFEATPPKAKPTETGPSTKGLAVFAPLYEAVEKGDLKIKKAALDDAIRITDARARAWASWTGKTPDEWYDLTFQVPAGASAVNPLPNMSTDTRGWARYIESQTVLKDYPSLWLKNDEGFTTLIHEIGHIIRYDIAYGPGGVPDLTMVDELDRAFSGKLSDGSGYFRRLFEGQASARKIGPDEELRFRRTFRGTLSPADAKIAEEAEEFFANAFVAYVREGVAPTPELKSVFSRMVTWLYEIVNAAVGWLSPLELADDQRKFFARLLDERGVSEKIATKPPKRPAAFGAIRKNDIVYVREGDFGTNLQPYVVVEALPEFDLYRVSEIGRKEPPIDVFGGELRFSPLDRVLTREIDKRLTARQKTAPLGAGDIPPFDIDWVYSVTLLRKPNRVMFISRGAQSTSEFLEKAVERVQKFRAMGYDARVVLPPSDYAILGKKDPRNISELEELRIVVRDTPEAQKIREEAGIGATPTPAPAPTPPAPAPAPTPPAPATTPAPTPPAPPPPAPPAPAPATTPAPPAPASAPPAPKPAPAPTPPELLTVPEPRNLPPAPAPAPAAVEPPSPAAVPPSLPPEEPPLPPTPPSGGAPPAGRGPRRVPRIGEPPPPPERPPEVQIPTNLEAEVLPEAFLALVRVWMPSSRINLSAEQATQLQREAYALLTKNAENNGSFLDFMFDLQNLTRRSFNAVDPRTTRVFGFGARAAAHARVLQSAADATKMALAPFKAQEVADTMRLFQGEYRKIKDYNGVLRFLNAIGQPATVTSAVGAYSGGAVARRSIQLLRIAQEPSGEEVWATNYMVKEIEDNIPKIIKELDARNNPARMSPGAALESGTKTLFSWWKTSVVTGLLIPNPRYFLNNMAGDFSQIWFEGSLGMAAKQSFQNLPINIPVLGRFFQNATSEMSARMGGVPVLGTVFNALFNPYLSRVWDGYQGTIRTKAGAVFSYSDLRRWLVEDGILDTFLHEELPQAFSRVVPTVWERTLGGWQKEIGQFGNYIQQRQRSGLYSELLRQGYTRAEARRFTLNALYDWKSAIAEGELMGIAAQIPFYRFWKLAMAQFGRGLMEPFVNPGAGFLKQAFMGQTKLARARQQVQFLDKVVTPGMSAMLSQEEYEDMDSKFADLARIIYPSWLVNRGANFSFPLSEEYARQLQVTRGYYVSDAAITLPKFTVIDTGAMYSALFTPLVAVAGAAAGHSLAPDWKEQFYMPALEQLGPLQREAILAMIEGSQGMGGQAQGPRVTPGEMLLMDKLPFFSTPVRDSETGEYRGSNLEVGMLRLIPFFGTQLTRLLDDVVTENPAALAAYGRYGKIAQLRAAAQLEEDPTVQADYLRKADALDAQQGETIIDAASWLMLRRMGVGPYPYSVEAETRGIVREATQRLEPMGKKAEAVPFEGWQYGGEPIEAERVMQMGEEP